MKSTEIVTGNLSESYNGPEKDKIEKLKNAQKNYEAVKLLKVFLKNIRYKENDDYDYMQAETAIAEFTLFLVSTLSVGISFERRTSSEYDSIARDILPKATLFLIESILSIIFSLKELLELFE